MTMSIAYNAQSYLDICIFKERKKRNRKYVNRKKQPKKVCIKRYIDKRK